MDNELLKRIQIKGGLLVIFWLIVFLVNLGPEWQHYSSVREALEVAGSKTVVQWLVSLVVLNFLVPNFLDTEKVFTFVVLFLLVLFIAAEGFILVSYLYLEPTYVETYGAFYLKNLNEYSLIERMGFSGLIKYIILSKLPILFFPSAILIAADFYQKQKQLLELREQKQAAELNALKNQLNPHFIFNTLNNIYSLALMRSENTAEAVAKLSGILDYVLYHCNESFVSLGKEVEMIENYIALEILRFGDRVNVSLINQVENAVQVAPLLYLTLIENAFKHSISQELAQANVEIKFSENKEYIIFEVINSKPKTGDTKSAKPAIGLKNLKKQLLLLYPQAHTLELSSSNTDYQAVLKLKKGQ